MQEGDETIGAICLRDISSRELHIPERPEVALHIASATTLTINQPRI
jgi:hypothetical protein